MLLICLFRFLRHLKKAALEFILSLTKLHQGIDKAADSVADLLIAFYPIVLKILRGINRRIERFCRFFLYLNWKTLKEVVVRTSDHRLTGFSAEMAYHATLALFPGLLTLLAAISLFESIQRTLYQMAALLGQLVPAEVESLIKSAIDYLLQNPNKEVFSFSFIGSLWVFSSVINSAIAALNEIHQVPRHRLRPFWQTKLIALGLAIGSLVLLILASGLVFISDWVVEIVARNSCILETVGTCPIEQISTCLYQPPVENCLLKSQLLATWRQLRWPITLGIVSTNYALIYYYGPSYRQPQTPLMPGAILAAVLWALVSNGFRWYVYHFGHFNSTYGTIGTFIILLLWLYISSLIMLVGAQLNVTVGIAIKRSKLSQSTENA